MLVKVKNHGNSHKKEHFCTLCMLTEQTIIYAIIFWLNNSTEFAKSLWIITVSITCATL